MSSDSNRSASGSWAVHQPYPPPQPAAPPVSRRPIPPPGGRSGGGFHIVQSPRMKTYNGPIGRTEIIDQDGVPVNYVWNGHLPMQYAVKGTQTDAFAFELNRAGRVYEDLLREGYQHTAHLPTPNEHRVFICCTLLDQLLLLLMWFEPTLQPFARLLRKELYKAIFTVPVEIAEELIDINQPVSANIFETFLPRYKPGTTWLWNAHKVNKANQDLQQNDNKKQDHIKKLQGLVEVHDTSRQTAKHNLAESQQSVAALKQRIADLEEQNKWLQGVNEKMTNIQQEGQENAVWRKAVETKMENLEERMKNAHEAEEKLKEELQKEKDAVRRYELQTAALEESLRKADHTIRQLEEAMKLDKESFTHREERLEQDLEWERNRTRDTEQRYTDLINAERARAISEVDHVRKDAKEQMDALKAAVNEDREGYRSELLGERKVRNEQESTARGLAQQVEQLQKDVNFWKDKANEVEASAQDANREIRELQDKVRSQEDMVNSSSLELMREAYTNEQLVRLCLEEEAARNAVQVKHWEEARSLLHIFIRDLLAEIIPNYTSMFNESQQLHRELAEERTRSQYMEKQVSDFDNQTSLIRKIERLIDDEEIQRWSHLQDYQIGQREIMAEMLQGFVDYIEVVYTMFVMREPTADITELENLKEERERLTSELDMSYNASSEMGRKLESRDREYRETHEKAMTLENDLTSVQERLAEAERDKERAGKDMEALSSQVDRAKEDYNQLKVKHQKLCDLTDAALCSMERSRDNQQLIDTCKYMLSSQKPSVDVLIAWANELASKHDTPPSNQISNFGGGKDMMDTYLCLLTLMAPQLVPNERYKELVAAQDEPKEAQAIMETLSTLGMPEYLTTDDLLDTEEGVAHAFALSALFSWFCDPSLTGGRKPDEGSEYGLDKADNYNSETNPAEERPYSAANSDRIAGLLKKDIGWWEDRAKTVDENKRFRMLGEAVNWDVERAAVYQARGPPKKATPEDLLRQADEHIQQQEWDKAMQCVEQALEMSPGLVPAHLRKAHIYHYGTNQPDLASQEYGEALKQDHKCAEAFRGRADLQQYIQHQPKAAKRDYDKAIKYGMQNADTYNNRCEAFMKLGDNSNAWNDVEIALQIDPNHARAQRNRDELLAEQQKEQKRKAEQAIKAAMSTLPTIQFERNRYELDAEDVESLNAVVGIMKMYPLIKLRVTGITVNKNKINLAKKRSQACVDYISERGVQKPRMEAVGVHGDQMATIFTPI
eukprot:TRINITY_DN67594_c4_g1_i1.p1 TRINITY_DN67594_c4_g1~~TRINITY_DN67594_c4_g1_i1.p1  ORF type:complete len:1330 (+),score=213.54 TRINITY_DN67594_c4_g1_i1:275-3991(+)